MTRSATSATASPRRMRSTSTGATPCDGQQVHAQGAPGPQEVVAHHGVVDLLHGSAERAAGRDARHTARRTPPTRSGGPRRSAPARPRAPARARVAVSSASVSRTASPQRGRVIAGRHGALDVGHEPVPEDVADQRVEASRSSRGRGCTAGDAVPAASSARHTRPRLARTSARRSRHQVRGSPAGQVGQPVDRPVGQVLEQPTACTRSQPATRCPRVR